MHVEGLFSFISNAFFDVISGLTVATFCHVAVLIALQLIRK